MREDYGKEDEEEEGWGGRVGCILEKLSAGAQQQQCVYVCALWWHSGPWMGGDGVGSQRTDGHDTRTAGGGGWVVRRGGWWRLLVEGVDENCVERDEISERGGAVDGM